MDPHSVPTVGNPHPLPHETPYPRGGGPSGDGASPAVRLKLWILSDLRIDRDPGFHLPDPLPDHDALLVAGGVSLDLEASLRWLEGELRDRPDRRPVVMVAGRSEHGSGVPVVTALARGRDLARELGMHFLADDAVRLQNAGGAGIVVVGSTLWTDWSLNGPFKGQLARVAAKHSWRDGKRMLLRPGRPWTPIDALGVHARSRAFLEDSLTNIVIQSVGFRPPPLSMVKGVRPGDRAVVLTHHAPSRRSLGPDWPGWHADEWVAAACASNLDDIMHAWGAPVLWVHGGMSGPVDYVLGRTRVVSNPRDRPRTPAGFRPTLVVEA